MICTAFAVSVPANPTREIGQEVYVNDTRVYRLDPEPQNVIVKAGELTTLTFENEKLAGVRIKKIDAVTGEGIYGVRFLIKDEHNNLLGEYSTDQDGYRPASR